ncbi:MAG TPA: hypothetical protein VLH19_01820 [Patescibacteria group bacterium]|nr:hypothetical protein [Patescibacteria group bacterium]
MKKAMTFIKKHLWFVGLIHAIGGIGVGIMIASPLAGAHPIRWGIAFIAVAALGHLYIWFA